MRCLGFAVLLLFAITALGQNVPVPYISEPLSPTTVAPGSQGLTLTVHGANFAPSAVLAWNGSQRPTTVISGSALQAPVYTSDLATAGFALVTVVNLGNKPQTSNTALFTIRKAAPAVSLTQDPYFTGSGNTAAIGDFNRDGIPDVATCGPNTGHGGSVINVYLGQGRNKFGSAITTPIKEVVICDALFTGDFNGDQLLDLAVAANDRLVICFGHGNGKFTLGPATQFRSSRRIPLYGFADVDGDGFLDLLLPGYPDVIIVMFGKGDGRFGSSVAVPIRKAAGNPVLGDFNEDGLLDIAVYENQEIGPTGVAISLNKGNRKFSRGGTYPLTCASIATADVNNDGHLDIVDCNGDVLLGKGEGGFTQGTQSNYNGSDPFSPIIADFNGDGNMDLLFLNQSVPALLLGNGDGTFQSPAPGGPASTVFYGLSDFNSDGHLALVGNIPAYNGSGITVFRQVSGGLYPGILTYAPQTVGTSSQPQTANLYNAGSTPLDLTSIQIGGSDHSDFSQTNNCPNSIPVGGNCQIQVTFTPTAVGNRQSSLVVSYTGPNGPQSVVLTGQGVAAVSVSLTPSSLTYALQLVKTTSAPQTATLTNTGSADVMISKISTSAEFGETNNCPATLPVGDNCQIQVKFKPTQAGQVNGTLSVVDNAPDSPQKVALSGVGTILTFKPIGVNFGDQKVSTSSNPVAFTFSNQGTVALSISSISFGGADPQDFSQTNNCPSSLAAGDNCTINVTFTPTQTGARSAALQVFDDATPSPQQAGVGGTGT